MTDTAYRKTGTIGVVAVIDVESLDVRRSSAVLLKWCVRAIERFSVSVIVQVGSTGSILAERQFNAIGWPIIRHADRFPLICQTVKQAAAVADDIVIVSACDRLADYVSNACTVAKPFEQVFNRGRATEQGNCGDVIDIDPGWLNQPGRQPLEGWQQGFTVGSPIVKQLDELFEGTRAELRVVPKQATKEPDDENGNSSAGSRQKRLF